MYKKNLPPVDLSFHVKHEDISPFDLNQNQRNQEKIHFFCLAASWEEEMKLIKTA